MIVDIHTHCFKEHVAARILCKLAAASGLIPCTDGTTAGLLREMEISGVDYAVLAPVAVVPEQMQSVNDFALAAAAASQGRVIAFAGIHPAAADMEQELRRVKALGARGVKFHPHYQEIYIDDPSVERMIRLASELDLPVLFHAGDDPGLPPPIYAPPERTARLLDRLADCRNLRLIAAHLGGWRMWDEVEKHLAGRPELYLDTACSGGLIDPEQYRRIILRHGPERVLFGSDCPWQGQDEALRYLRALQLPAADEAKIEGGNAARLLGL